VARILIVDDEPDIVEFQKSFLTRRKHEVFAATDTESALAVIRKETLDIVFCDLRVDTDTSGLDILEEVKKAKAAPAFYLITGIIDRKMQEEALRKGAKEVIYKPVPNQTLEAKIKEAGF